MHIGHEIRSKLKEQGRTVTWLSTRLSCSRVNVYKIFEKSSLDTDLLLRISCALNFDFFSLYADEIHNRT